MVARAIIFRGAVISFAMQLRAHFNQGANRYDDVQILGDGASTAWCSCVRCAAQVQLSSAT